MQLPEHLSVSAQDAQQNRGKPIGRLTTLVPVRLRKRVRMTIPKDIPEKWFPIVLPLQQKKQQGLDAAKTKKKWTGTSVCHCHVSHLFICSVCVFVHWMGKCAVASIFMIYCVLTDDRQDLLAM